jgi:hypothetical protein
MNGETSLRKSRKRSGRHWRSVELVFHVVLKNREAFMRSLIDDGLARLLATKIAHDLGSEKTEV